MINYPRLALKVRSTHFAKLINIGNEVVLGLSSNPSFSNPSPTVNSLQLQIAVVRAALTAWGPTSNRGSRADYQNLCNEALKLHLILKAMADYVQNTAAQAAKTDYPLMAAILASSGFTLVKEKSKHTTLQAVRGFRIMNGSQLNRNQVKLKWARPLETSTTNDVYSYQVLKGTVPDIHLAKNVANTTQGEFIDTNSTGAIITWFYWIIPYNSVGAGASSSYLEVTLLKA